jgi:Tfp pilus assembly protein PilF
MTAPLHEPDADAQPASGSRSVKDLLTRREGEGPLIQGLCPIVESVAWLRSQRYWEQAGANVFTSGEVPYIVTNDGDQSSKAVELYVRSLRAAEQRQRRPDPKRTHYVLEFGIGTGLFAKSFLDQLKARSQRERTQDYELTTYIAADHSRGLLDDSESTGVLTDHEARVVRLHVPASGLAAALRARLPQAVGALRAVHANYVLDSLPFTILSRTETCLYELQMLTRFAKGTAQTEAPASLAGAPRALEAWLNEVLPVERGGGATAPAALLFECEYVEVAQGSMPFPHLIPAFEAASAGGGSQQLIHSYGAVRFVEEVLGLLGPDGHFIGVDYSCDAVQAEPLEFQVFGASIAAPVNFSQLIAHAQARPDCIVGVPTEDPTSLQARLFARAEAPPEVTELFPLLYCREAAERSAAPLQEALSLVQGGRYEAARWKFEEAHRRQPYNWHLLEAIVAFLSHTLEEHSAALEVAQRALALNHLSPRLWNLLGDCHYGQNAFDAAERAYRQALRVNPTDVRGHANLAYVFLERGAHGEALRVIGEALAFDRSGEFRDELLSKQGEALRGLATAHVNYARNNLNRLSGHFALPGSSSFGKTSSEERRWPTRILDR